MEKWVAICRLLFLKAISSFNGLMSCVGGSENFEPNLRSKVVLVLLKVLKIVVLDFFDMLEAMLRL